MQNIRLPACLRLPQDQSWESNSFNRILAILPCLFSFLSLQLTLRDLASRRSSREATPGTTADINWCARPASPAVPPALLWLPRARRRLVSLSPRATGPIISDAFSTSVLTAAGQEWRFAFYRVQTYCITYTALQFYATRQFLPTSGRHAMSATMTCQCQYLTLDGTTTATQWRATGELRRCHVVPPAACTSSCCVDGNGASMGSNTVVGRWESLTSSRT